MRDDTGSDRTDTWFDMSALPDAVRRLADAMIGIDPGWKLSDWLSKAAEEEMMILTLDLERERLQLEQRMHRVEAIAKRLEPVDEVVLKDGQQNLFDCFDVTDRGLNSSAAAPPPAALDENDVEEPHPASYLTSMLPGDQSDDPLLAITAQCVMLEIDRIVDSGLGLAPINIIFERLAERGIQEVEVDEAIDFLLMQGAIHEVEDDCFICDE